MCIMTWCKMLLSGDRIFSCHESYRTFRGLTLFLVMSFGSCSFLGQGSIPADLSSGSDGPSWPVTARLAIQSLPCSPASAAHACTCPSSCSGEQPSPFHSLQVLISMQMHVMAFTYQAAISLLNNNNKHLHITEKIIIFSTEISC